MRTTKTSKREIVTWRVVNATTGIYRVPAGSLVFRNITDPVRASAVSYVLRFKNKNLNALSIQFNQTENY